LGKIIDVKILFAAYTVKLCKMFILNSHYMTLKDDKAGTSAEPSNFPDKLVLKLYKNVVKIENNLINSTSGSKSLHFESQFFFQKINTILY